MLVPDSEMPGGERAKILDFGIAKLVAEHENPGSEEYRTNTGMVLGTATYMAPEQCKGAGNVTEKADVYSLGVREKGSRRRGASDGARQRRTETYGSGRASGGRGGGGYGDYLNWWRPMAKPIDSSAFHTTGP
jgi:hypothetical protein